MAPRTLNDSEQTPTPPAIRRPVPAAGTPYPGAPLPRAHWELESVAIFCGDLLRPVAWLGTQVLLVAQPTLALLGAAAHGDRLAHYLDALDSPASADPPTRSEEELSC